MNPPLLATRTQKGFTLAEMAVVVVIVALLIGGMLIPLGAQQDIRAERETQARLAEIKELLIGYAVANGRLPCPAASTSGIAAPATSGACTSVSNGVAYGYLPAVTLGYAAVDSSGHALDGWHEPIRYAVSAPTAGVGGIPNPFTTTSISGAGMKGATMTSIASATLLSVCTSASNIKSGTAGTATAECGTSGKLTDNAVAVIWSTGKNTETGGTGSDESNNPNPNSTVAVDPAFVYHESAPSTASGGEFDDQVTWISPNILFNRMMTAGWLP